MDDWASECEELVRSVERLGKELDALIADAGRAAQQQAEAQAKALIDAYVRADQREQAWRLVQRGERIAGEVAAWAAEQGPLGLARRLWPEVRAALDEELGRGGAGSPGSPPA